MFQLKVLNANLDDDEVESHAAKLLEIVILQCHNKIDHVLPSLLKIVFERLAREIISTELRTMCLQVVVILGLCTLLQLVTKRPHDVAQIADKILPSTCTLLENLEKVYAGKPFFQLN